MTNTTLDFDALLKNLDPKQLRALSKKAARAAKRPVTSAVFRATDPRLDPLANALHEANKAFGLKSQDTLMLLLRRLKLGFIIVRGRASTMKLPVDKTGKGSPVKKRARKADTASSKPEESSTKSTKKVQTPPAKKTAVKRATRQPKKPTKKA